MKKITKIIALSLALSFSFVFADEWYQVATPTNVLTCSLTNFPGSPSFYSVYWISNSALIRYSTYAVPIPFTNIFRSVPSGIYSLYMTATTTNGVETLSSTNIYVYWWTPPASLVGPTGISVK